MEICGKLFGRGDGKSGKQKPILVKAGGEPSDSQSPLRACSACAGDYEDPDRTAWRPDEEEQDLPVETVQERAQEKAENGDEFPAQEA